MQIGISNIKVKQIAVVVLIFINSGVARAQKGHNTRHEGVYYVLEGGYLSVFGNSGLNPNGVPFPSPSHAFRLRNSVGYFINPRLAVGLGFGLDGYHKPTFNTAPLYLEARGFLKDEPYTPFAFLNIGTLAKISETHRSGLFSSLGVGLQFQKKVLSVGLNFQQISNQTVNVFTGNPVRIEEQNVSFTITSISINFGWLF